VECSNHCRGHSTLGVVRGGLEGTPAPAQAQTAAAQRRLLCPAALEDDRPPHRHHAALPGAVRVHDVRSCAPRTPALHYHRPPDHGGVTQQLREAMLAVATGSGPSTSGCTHAPSTSARGAANGMVVRQYRSPLGRPAAERISRSPYVSRRRSPRAWECHDAPPPAVSGGESRSAPEVTLQRGLGLRDATMIGVGAGAK
jgi:hypothetical protein